MGAGTKKKKSKRSKESGPESRTRKVCCCGLCCLGGGFFLLGSGIALLVIYARYWGMSDEVTDHDSLKGGDVFFYESYKNLANTGLGFFFFSFVMMAIGVIVFVVLYKMRRRAEAPRVLKPATFIPPRHAPGEAPYPQQPSHSPCFAISESTPLNEDLDADESPPDSPPLPPPPSPPPPETPPTTGMDPVISTEIEVEVTC